MESGTRPASARESRPGQIRVLRQEAPYQINVTAAHGEKQLDGRRVIPRDRDSRSSLNHDHNDLRRATNRKLRQTGVGDGLWLIPAQPVPALPLCPPAKSNLLVCGWVALAAGVLSTPEPESWCVAIIAVVETCR
jgi:hypothetical protein